MVRIMPVEPRGEPHGGMVAPKLREFILGGQDGLVNVLGLVLGVAAATAATKIVLIAALTATFAESISMAAVAYTSTKAAYSYYKSELEKEKWEVEIAPKRETKEIRNIYYKKGFRGGLLEKIVNKLTSNKRIWVHTMMEEELNLHPEEYENPLGSGIRVGIAAFVGSIIPIIPFFFMAVKPAMVASLIIAVLTLFAAGATKAKITVGNWVKEGFELAAIGTLAAVVGYLVGVVLGML